MKKTVVENASKTSTIKEIFTLFEFKEINNKNEIKISWFK